MPSLVDLIEQRMSEATADHRRAVELLALGEPLALDEISALTSDETLIDAESHGLIATAGTEVRLAHPLYGEAVRATLPPLRARSLRLQLVDVMEARDGFGPGDALRAARLRLDAGVALSPGLALDAARAANGAGDPDLGAELAELAGADSDLTAGMLLAQSHAMRNRYEQAEGALVVVEPLAPGDPNAREYLRQRLWLYHWGLRRAADSDALLDRAQTWSGDADWRRFISRIRRTYAALSDGFAAPPEPVESTGDPGVSDAPRRSLLALRTMSAFLSGAGDAAAAEAFVQRPPVPLRDDADAAALGTLSLIAVEAGYRWDELERYMGEAMRHAVRARDHVAAGLSAFTIARLHFFRARHRDAARWVAEAEVHFQQHDPFNVMLTVRALQVGIACFTGDFDGTMAALAQLHAWSDSHGPLPAQRVPVRRAEGWALRMRDPAQAGRQLLEDAELARGDGGPGAAAGLRRAASGSAGRAGAGADGRPQRVAARRRVRAPWFGEGGPRRLGSDGRGRGDGRDRRAPLRRRGCQRRRERIRRGRASGFGAASGGPRPRAARPRPGRRASRSTGSTPSRSISPRARRS